MRIKENFILQKIVDEYLVVPIAEEADRLHGVIRLNETGAILWNCLEKGVTSKEELEYTLLTKYNHLNQSGVHTDVETFINQLTSFGCLVD